MNFKSLKAALGQAVQQGATYAKDLSSQVVGAKVLRDYTVGAQVASGGPGCLWKIHTARCKREGAANALVSVWFLEKRPPDDLRHGSATWDDFLELCRKDAANLTRLKHPGIVKLVEPFEETRNQLVLVTEPIILSLANVLREYDGLPAAVSSHHRDLKMSELERKHGLLQISDTLHFLHAEANLVHCALCPEAVFLTGAGAWKLASLAHCVQVQYTVDEAAGRTFDYIEGAASARLLAPPLNYVAPELIASNGASAPPPLSPASDMFSLGCIAYELLAQRPFMPPRCSVTDHQARVAGLALMDLSPVNVGFQSVMRQLLSGTASIRPSATAFQGATYFQDDVLVRALRFLDNLLQRDNLQKAAFLKDAARLWPRLDMRVLRFSVLPPLLVELRNEALQALVLPLVLGIIPQQDEPDFMDWTLPSLLPIATSAKGEALLVFTRNAALLATSMPQEAVRKLIVPLLVRAADQGDAQTQEEMVKAVPMLADIVAYEDLKAELLPRVCGLCLSTSSAGVRTGALMSMGKLLPAIEVDEAKKMMAICAKVVSIDHTPGTTMCVIGLGSAVARQWGPGEGARSALPVMTPCLAVAELTSQQYTTAMRSVREILAALDAQRNTAGGGAASSKASSSSSLNALDTLPAPSGLAASGKPASASSSPRPAYEPAKIAPAATSKLAPPAKANTLADAFNLAAGVSPPAAVPPLPGAAAAADDIFDFQLISRGGDSSGSGPGSGTGSGIGGQSMPGSMGGQSKRQPMMGQSPTLGQAPVMGQAPADDFGDFGSFSGAPQPQQQQHAALSSPFPAPPTAPKHDSGFDSLI